MQTMTTAQSLGQILQHLSPLKNAAPWTPKSNPNSKPSVTNCQTCRSLDECQYQHHKGFRPIRTEHGTAIAPCQYYNTWRHNFLIKNYQAKSNIPAAYHSLTLNDFKVTDDNAQAFNAALNLTSLYLFGESGTGKTMLLSLIGNEHINQGRRVQYTTAAEMLLQLRYTVDDCESRLRHYQTVPVLLLDDLARERQSEYAEEQLYMVIDGRQRSRLTTIITSEQSLAELRGRYSEGLRNKIRDLTEREEHIRRDSPNNQPLLTANC